MVESEQVCISMVSKKTKELVREFHIFKNHRPYLELTGSIGYIEGLSRPGNVFYQFQNGNIDIWAESKFRFSAPQFDAKSWLKHFLYIFRISRIATLHLTLSDGGLNESQLPMITECLKDVKISKLSIGFATQFPLMIKLLSAFPPNIELGLHATNPQPLDSSQQLELRQVLPNKLQKLNSSIYLPLNELLFVTCSFIDTFYPELTEQEINVFLKHWIAGLKSGLEYFRSVKRGPALNQDTILKGIPHEIAPSNRKFKLFEVDSGMTPKVGGIDIHLGQGIKATIILEHRFDYAELFVAVHDSEYILFE